MPYLESIGNRGSRKQHGTGLAACLGLLIWLLTLGGNAFITVLPGPNDLRVWWSPNWVTALGLIVFGLAVSAFILVHTWKRPLSTSTGLAWLGPVATGHLLLFPLAPELSSNLFFYGSPLCLAGIFLFCWHGGEPSVLPRHFQAVLIFLGSTLFFTVSGQHFTKSVGAHSGDEGHYLTQAQSLKEDGDLDLTNNLPDDAPKNQGAYHISLASKNGKLYSWHTPGLAYVLAPAAPDNLLGRHLILGSIAGLGLTGMFTLCLLLGGRSRCAVGMALALGGSAVWVVYASRALPEVLGATLATWTAVAVLWQQRRPWLSMWLATGCLCVLPIVQTRFVPLALTGMGCYGLAGLLYSEERWVPRLFRLAVFATIVALGGAAYIAFQHSRFESGSAYPVGDLLFSLPMGLWHSISSCRGINFALPLFVPSLVAGVMLLFRSSGPRAGWVPLLMFAGVYISSCATIWYTAGSCLPGRFLVSVTPLVGALAASRIETFSRGFRLLMAYLASLSLLMSVIELMHLGWFGKGFVDPYKVDFFHPTFQRLWRLFYDPYTGTQLFPGLALLLIAGFLCSVGHRHRVQQTTALSILVLISLLTAAGHGPRPSDAEQARANSRLLSAHRWRLPWFAASASGQTPISAFANDFAEIAPDPKAVTTEDLGDVTVEGVISIPHLPENDWAGRSYRWATLVKPFRAGKGERYLRLVGKVEGDVQIDLAVREGADLIIERALRVDNGFFDLPLVFTARNRGDLYIVARLHGGEGRMALDAVEYTPSSEAMVTATKLRLPDKTQTVD